MDALISEDEIKGARLSTVALCDACFTLTVNVHVVKCLS